MANSKYEYVKSFELEDKILFSTFIVVLIDGRHFRRFSDVHGFEKPNDEKALNLMNACASSVLKEFTDILFSYGFSDEYSFVFKKTTKFKERRASKLVSLIVSLFSSIYATKWKEFFPGKEMRYPPSFHGRVICCASTDVLQQYLAWRQKNCHEDNQHYTCLWNLVKTGKTETEAQETLKGTQKQDKNELLFQRFGVNYNKLPEMFRQGSFVFMTREEDIAKYCENGTPIKRSKSNREARIVHSKNIAGKNFWCAHENLLKELGGYAGDTGKINPDCINSFLFENKLMPSTWIVVRIDGYHFHRFCDIHEFEKPNDEQALKLMNSCAVAVMQEFPDINFSYGLSDEYSFVLKKDSQFCQRRGSDVISVIVSFFTSTYVMNWNSFFPQKEMKCSPSFDSRAICYPSTEILRDYLAWRQVDCHINNQYNSCFWALVKSGKSKKEAQHILKGTQTGEKNEILAQFGIDYSRLSDISRRGSSIFRDENVIKDENVRSVEELNNKVIIEHCNIIEDSFWEEHPTILNQKVTSS